MGLKLLYCHSAFNHLPHSPSILPFFLTSHNLVFNLLLHHIILHHTNFNFNTNFHSQDIIFQFIMKNIQQFASVLPFGQVVLHKAEGLYGFSKNKTLSVYNQTKGTINQTRKNYLQFRGNLRTTVNNIINETINEVLDRFESLVGVQNSEKASEERQKARNRLQTIFQTIFREYVLRNRMVDNARVQSVMRLGKKYSLEYIIPLYVSLRATLIVSKQMLIQFMEDRLNAIKLNYESSKDNVVMVIAGKFNQQNLRNKIFQGINSFKRFTVKVVNKGLQIRVDRQSLVENYDKFALNFLEIIKEMRVKGQDNITQMKKKSRSLYNEVVKRIRAKQLEIKTDLRVLNPQNFLQDKKQQ